jgi:hypothetical protein
MTDLFLSYKREDETRVTRLVNALQKSSLTVWWDRGLAGGQNWRTEIHHALAAAKCVIVVWTHASVGPDGDFVRDEAQNAKRRNVLIPVILDPVDPPLGFGEIQAIDLTRWNGNPRDPSFQDLLAAVKATIEGRPAPPAHGPTKRLLRRLRYSGIAGAITLAALAFGFNIFHAQEKVCAAPILQPGISDACGALGLGDRPTATERIAWESREPGSCRALQSHIERFPRGAFRYEAAALLAARRVTSKETWESRTRPLPLHEADDEVPYPDEKAARAAAINRAKATAQERCGGFAATQSFRLKSATPEPRTWNCSAIAGGVTCGFDGQALCALEESHPQEYETCGK